MLLAELLSHEGLVEDFSSDSADGPGVGVALEIDGQGDGYG